MSGGDRVTGFQDIWRAPGVRWLSDNAILKPSSGGVKARLRRLAARTPEVVVSVTSAMHAPRQLHNHLNYISRGGQLELEGPDGLKVSGQGEIRELAEDWIWAARTDSRCTPTTTVARAMVLSMPPGTDGERLEAAARAFLQVTFETNDYAFVRHTDAPNPHIHVTVRSLGRDGQRFTPQKSHLDTFRQDFAQALREFGVSAEASPRRARGVVRKPEPRRLKHVRDKYAAGLGHMADVDLRELILVQYGQLPLDDEPWRRPIQAWRIKISATYGVAADLLSRSADPEDRALGAEIQRFIREMPRAETRRDLEATEGLRRFERFEQAPSRLLPLPTTRERDRER